MRAKTRVRTGKANALVTNQSRCNCEGSCMVPNPVVPTVETALMKNACVARRGEHRGAFRRILTQPTGVGRAFPTTIPGGSIQPLTRHHSTPLNTTDRPLSRFVRTLCDSRGAAHESSQSGIKPPNRQNTSNQAIIAIYLPVSIQVSVLTKPRCRRSDPSERFPLRTPTSGVP